MGGGASAGITAAVTSASADELCAVLNDLPAAQREKLASALKGDPLDDALTKLFHVYDLDNSGYITIDEALAMDREFQKLCGADFNEEETRQTFLESDTNKDGKVVLAEFIAKFKKTGKEAGLSDADLAGMASQVAGMMAASKADGKEKMTIDDALTGLFQIYDIDKSGFITLDEILKTDKAFSEVCGAAFDEEETKKTFSESDENKDQKVSLKEFVAYFKKNMADQGLSEDQMLGFVKMTNKMMIESKS